MGEVMRKRKVKKAVKRKVKTLKASPRKETDYNKKALWKAYKELQIRAEKAWHKFRDDVRKNAKSDILVKDHNHLLLILGECNYMARECMRMASKNRKRS